MLNDVAKITFCGHGQIVGGDEVFNELLATLEKFFYNANEQGVELVFYCGAYGNFDGMSARAIDVLRKKYPNVKTRKLFITPYLTESYKERIDALKDSYDEVVFPPIEHVPPRYAIPERNKWMIRECEYVIAYVTHGWGGAAKTLQYAYKKEKKIYRIISNYDVT